MRSQEFLTEALHFVRPGELRGSYTDQQMLAMGFRRSQNGTWYIDKKRWDSLVQSGQLREMQTQMLGHTADGQQVLDYINKTHHEPMVPEIEQAVLRHPKWQLTTVNLSDLNIPDQSYDDEEDEPPMDPYGRVMDVDPGHAGEYSAHIVDKKPIVVDAHGFIIDGNHRAWAAAELLNRNSIKAWVPAEVDENFADGKVKGKSRPGRVKRAGASCSGSVTSLRAKAKKYGGEKGKMYHWCANMKSGRNLEEDDLEEDLKSALASMALAGGMAMTPQAQAMPKPIGTQYALQQQASQQNQQAFASPMAQTLKKYAVQAGMRGAELAQFMAQCAHETANFTRLKEFGGSLDFRKYDPKFAPKKARALGNVKPGDGARYHGRGFIQLTGRDNYRRAGQALGLPLEQRPELVERPDVAAKVAIWFWQNRVVPRVDNFADTAQVTKPINPGMRGLDDRHTKFQTYKMALAPTTQGLKK